MRHTNVLCPLYWLILWNGSYLKFRASPWLWLRKYGMYSAFCSLRRSRKLSKSYGYITVPELWKVGRFKRWRKREQIPTNADNIYQFGTVLCKQMFVTKAIKCVACTVCYFDSYFYVLHIGSHLGYITLVSLFWWILLKCHVMRCEVLNSSIVPVFAWRSWKKPQSFFGQEI
jgi:hypothetical protein